MKLRVKHVHFIGIGGVGMSGLAEILAASGYGVSGSDVRESATTERLRTLGVRVAIGHDPAQIAGADVVVYSAAVRATNPELVAALAAKVPTIPRAEMLAELMRMKNGIAVAGSHGKTTTTSMIGQILEHAGLDPTIVVGGRVRSLGSNSRLGAGDVLVAEADESDGSFLKLLPTVVVITNVDREHLDHYGSFERLQQAFVDFANRVPFWGACVLCLDDPVVRALLPQIVRRPRTYGLAAQAEISADRIEAHAEGTTFRVLSDGSPLGTIELAQFGRHNVGNALAAASVALELGVSFEAIAVALGAFRGVERRFERRGERDGVVVIDDYAHHPTEIRATLAAAREAFPGRRIIVAFQPHRYTRTRDVFDGLASSFHDADVLVLAEIYAAGEDKLPDIDASALAKAARDRGHRAVETGLEKAELHERIDAHARSGDVVIFMGAGDITREAGVFLERPPELGGAST